MKNTITEMNSWEESDSRIWEAEEWISKVEDKLVEITNVEQNKGKRMKRNEDSLWELWNNFKLINVHTMRFQKEKRERARENSEEIIAKNFSNMGKESLT